MLPYSLRYVTNSKEIEKERSHLSRSLVSFPSKIWFDLTFFMVAWWINLGVNTAVTQMSLHVEYFKWIQGPRVVCVVSSWLSNLQLASSSPPHCGFPWPRHRFYSNPSSPRACSFPALLLRQTDSIVFCALCSYLLTLISTQTLRHPAPTWRWQGCSDRKPSLDKTEASRAFLNSSQMLAERASPPGSPVS